MSAGMGSWRATSTEAGGPAAFGGGGGVLGMSTSEAWDCTASPRLHCCLHKALFFHLGEALWISSKLQRRSPPIISKLLPPSSAGIRERVDGGEADPGEKALAREGLQGLGKVKQVVPANQLCHCPSEHPPVFSRQARETVPSGLAGRLLLLSYRFHTGQGSGHPSKARPQYL
ncbi:hypothetical protein SRHO_G00038060 [Serrasalmus rhombeus]